MILVNYFFFKEGMNPFYGKFKMKSRGKINSYVVFDGNKKADTPTFAILLDPSLSVSLSPYEVYKTRTRDEKMMLKFQIIIFNKNTLIKVNFFVHFWSSSFV